MVYIKRLLYTLIRIIMTFFGGIFLIISIIIFPFIALVMYIINRRKISEEYSIKVFKLMDGISNLNFDK